MKLRCRGRFAGATLVALAACGPAEVVSASGCDAGAVSDLVGRPIDDRAALAQAAPRVRFFDEGDAVTQDFIEDRLNIVTGADGRVTRVFCG